ncbi:MAG: trypsin-like peptidase domain-containing protein [Planctomycetota bacterium]
MSHTTPGRTTANPSPRASSHVRTAGHAGHHRRRRSWLRRSAVVLMGVLSIGAVATPAIADPLRTPAQPRASRAISFTAQSDTVDLVGLEQAFGRVSKSVSPSVVAITATNVVPPAGADVRSSKLTSETVDELLRAGPKVVGTGFCIDADGYILTNEHVISGAKQIYVTTDRGRIFPAIVVGTDPRSDLAVLKIPAALPAVTFAPETSVRRGQWTIALGNPIGLAIGGEMSMSVGVVSAVGRHLPKLSEKEGRLYSNLIQTTAEVNPGNSGGPLFDLTGRVIGIVTAVVLPQKQTNGLGFAMPADGAMMSKVRRLMRGEPVVHGYLGVAVREQAAGPVRVATVGTDTPATGKILPGDELLRVNGYAIEDEASFIRLVGSSPTDRAVPVVLRRQGREVAVNVYLEPRADASGIDRFRQRLHWQGITFGVTASPVGDRVCVLNIDPNSPIASSLRPGAIVKGVARQPAADLATLQLLLDRTPRDRLSLNLATPADLAAAATGAQTAAVVP